MGFQLERDDLIVAHLPHLAAPMPLPTRLFHPFPHLYFGKAYAHPNQRVSSTTWRGRVPLALCNDALHGLKAFLPLRIVAIAHTDETVALRSEQLSRAFLVRVEMEESTPYDNKVPNSPG